MSTRTKRPLTIPQLGKFVMLRMRWPDFVEDASNDPELVGELETWLRRVRHGAASNTVANLQNEGAMPTEPKELAALTRQAAYWAEEKG